MMTKKRAGIAAATIALVATAVYLITGTGGNMAYLPVAPLQCRYDTVGIAWMHGNMNAVRSRFCARAGFYNSTSWHSSSPKGRIPVLNHDNYTSLVVSLQQQNYCANGGMIKLLNEPDGPGIGQDNVTVAQAATAFRYVSAALPGCQIIWPNAISADYLDRALKELGSAYYNRLTIGFHIYQPGDPLAPVTWPKQWIETIRTVAVNNGARNRPLVISEVGPSNLWSYQHLVRYYQELFDSRLPVFVYTFNCGGFSGHACRRELCANADCTQFTRSGQAFRYVMFGSWVGVPAPAAPLNQPLQAYPGRSVGVPIQGYPAPTLP